MGYTLVYASPLFRDRQDEPPLAICPECLGEIYENDEFTEAEAGLYHAACRERKQNYGNRGDLPLGEG